jgi:hypothetical protein
MRAERVRIEADECGFVLEVETDEGEYFSFVLDDAEALYDHVKAAIGPWLYEREQARATMPTRRLSDEDFEAYVADAYGDDFAKAEGMRQMREEGYC